MRLKDTLSFATADTNKSMRICQDGIITHLVLILPNFTTAGTVKGLVQVLDPDGNIIYNPGAVAENTTTVYGVSSAIAVPVSPGSTIKVIGVENDGTTPSAAGGAHDAVVSFYIKDK